ncbi:hypothetical protein H5410_027930 [Solanum commersonii]|uniref:Uncharacterized protein n=1 Tax=Solanum commersonii TaxID=4109 RepID=A0A9J5Z5Y9_SOLCO|nr:hypothetical protein H5410_027930 [Solanum commersonii]
MLLTSFRLQIIFITTLCTKVDSMDNEIQKLKTNEDNLKSIISQQHDYKNAELRTSQRVSEKHKNSNLNQLFEKPFTPMLTPNELANNYLNENAIWSYYARDQLMIYSNSSELRKSDMDEVQTWILSLLKPEERSTTRALKEGFISTELLTRYCKLIGHKYLIIYVQNVIEQII